MMEILKEILDDCDNEADRSFVKELLLLPDLSSVFSDKYEQDLLESLGRSHSDEWKEQGDFTLQDVMSGWEEEAVRSPPVSVARSKSDSLKSSSTTHLNLVPSRSRRDKREENVNTNMMRRLPKAGRMVEFRKHPSSIEDQEDKAVSDNKSTASIETLLSRLLYPRRIGKKIRRFRSAPELRRPVEKEELFRSLSQHHLPFSYSSRPDGLQVLRIEEGEENPCCLLWGEEAYRHYKLLTLIEKKEKLDQIQSAKKNIVKSFMWKQRVLEDIVKVAKAYYRRPTKENQEKWKRLRQYMEESSDHSLTDLQHQLNKIVHRFPYFTIFLMAAHVLSLIIMCAVSGLAPVGLLSEKKEAKGVQTFLGAETIHGFNIPNPWIGPPITTLLGAGASFAPCLRKEHRLEREGERRGYRMLDDSLYGCCQMQGAINAAGTTTAKECRNFTNNAGMWKPPLCSKRRPDQDSVPHVIKPCCMDHRGNCRMMSHQHCTFLGGFFHDELDHCVQVLCINDICMIRKNHSVMDADPQQPWLPHENTRWQWWRPLVASLYTHGLVDCLAILALEWLLMWPLENTAGALVIMFIYIWCATAGQIVACMAQPYVPQLGSTSGIAGMVGEAAVELIHAWDLLGRPWSEAIKLGAYATVLLVLGFLPFVSLLGTLTGGACGAMCALIFMPYITLDVSSQTRKTMLMIGATVVQLVFFIVILYTFIALQPQICQACRSLECLPFSQNMCNDWDLLG